MALTTGVNNMQAIKLTKGWKNDMYTNKLLKLINKLDEGELITISVSTANALYNYMNDQCFDLSEYRQARNDYNKIEIWMA